MIKFLKQLILGVLFCFLILSACSARETPVPLPVTPPKGSGGTAPAGNDAAPEEGEMSKVPEFIKNEHRVDLFIPQVLNITKPDKETLTTTYDKYFITGTSDPKAPIYIDGEEIDRLGGKGTFGVFVELEIGENSFVFSQGEEEITIVLEREEHSPDEILPISGINADSMVPAIFSGVKLGGELELGCVAPSGAKITAEFGGETVELTQVAETEEPGIPAFYKASLAVEGDYAEDITQNAGKVTYTMEYGDESAAYESNGDVYVAGKNSNIAIKVKDYMGFVYDDTDDLSVFREKLKLGAVDYMRAEDNKYAELSSGGFIAKEQLEVVEGKVAVAGRLTNVAAEFSKKGESYIFNCKNKPAYLTSLSDGKFSIVFFNTQGMPDVDVKKSRLFFDADASGGENYAAYTFALNDNAEIWGYNLNYRDGGAELSFKYKPQLKEEPRPFEDITIVLDPGHGGEDVGALGVASLTGPVESEVNLAHAIAAGKLLREMGANVVLTQYDDSYYHLNSRLASPEEYDADFFVSIHHNSIGGYGDANAASGMEIYYHTDLSRQFADTLISAIADAMGREIRLADQSYYRVTLSPYSPAVLLELGFMTNPVDYEKATDKGEIDRVAAAVAGGIKKSLSPAIEK